MRLRYQATHQYVKHNGIEQMPEKMRAHRKILADFEIVRA
jgi:hypothetical protein